MPLNFKFITSGQSESDAAIVSQIIRGRSLLPMAPANLRGTRNVAGDLLIEWDRRTRIGGGLRPSTDVPIAEEDERYLLWIYSGSTLVRTISITGVLTPELVSWSKIRDDRADPNAGYDNITGITITGGTVNYQGGAFSVLGVVDGSRRFKDDFIIESTVSNTLLTPLRIGAFLESTNLGFGASPAAPTTGVYWAGKNNDWTVVYPQGDTTVPITVAANDKLSIYRTGARVRYYVNYVGPTSIPVYEFAFNTNEQLKPFSMNYTVTGEAEAADCTIAVLRRSAYNYVAPLQVIDFGSVQNPIKVRVAAVSSVVGPGPYTEALL